jgi:hypothetical protein
VTGVQTCALPISLVIDRQTLPETILPFIGSPRIAVAAEHNRVVLSPAEDETEPYIDGPDSDYIDPADYDNTTAYLNAIPGMAESIIKGMNTPLNELEDWD